MLTRRALLQAGGLALAGPVAPQAARPAGRAEVRMHSDLRGEHVWFDPVGLLIEPGQTVRWVVATPGNPHATTAYHAANAKHSLRIPEAATPWDSGFLVNEGDAFDVTFTVEEVYDYFCLPHEHAGMVGRILVGRPGGPGILPFDYFSGRADAAGWLPVPVVAQKGFLSVQRIVQGRVVRPHPRRRGRGCTCQS